MRNRSFINSLLWASLFLGANGTSYDIPEITIEEESTSSNVIDSRPDGVSYEASLANFASYLRMVSPGDSLDDFLKPGHHTLRLDSDGETTNKFLSHILNSRIADASTWDVEVIKAKYYPPAKLNFTLVSQFIQTIPSINSIRWSSVDQIPLDLLQTIEQQHPTTKLYYYSLFTSESHSSEQEEYKMCQDETHFEVVFRDSPDMDRYENSQIERERIRFQKVQQEKRERRQNREALISSETLYSLTVGPAVENFPDSEKIDLVHRLLISCPNIRELKLAMGWSIPYVGKFKPSGLNFEVNNQTLAPLESLDLTDYPFKSERNGKRWMDGEFGYPGSKRVWLAWSWVPRPLANAFGYEKYQQPNAVNEEYAKRKAFSSKGEARTNLDYWLERMDWSKLRILTLHNPVAYELENFPGDVLSGLTTAEFENGDRNAIVRFLDNTVRSLESISISSESIKSPDDILEVVYEKHSKTLKSLTLRHADTLFDSDWISDIDRIRLYPKTSFLNEDNLAKLLQKSPGLQSLNIDFRIGDSWDYGVLDTLAKFEELTELKLVVNDFVQRISTKGEDHEAWMSKVGIEGYLRKKKKGAEFTKLEVSLAEYRTSSHY